MSRERKLSEVDVNNNRELNSGSRHKVGSEGWDEGKNYDS
jgi:hypothetical protein